MLLHTLSRRSCPSQLSSPSGFPQILHRRVSFGGFGAQELLVVALVRSQSLLLGRQVVIRLPRGHPPYLTSNSTRKARCRCHSYSMPDKGRSMMWFRKGLRLHDNPALLEAIDGTEHLYPVFCLDPGIIEKKEAVVGVNRMQFLLESLSDLNSNLKTRGSRLIVLHGQPQELLPKVWSDWGITKLCFEVDTEPYAKERDSAIQKLADKQGIKVETHISHTLYDTAQINKNNGNKPVTSLKQLQKAADKCGPPPEPVSDPPDKLPGVPKDAKGAEEKSTQVPSLKDLGYTQTPTTPFHGGETAALARLADKLKDKDWVAQFEKPKGNPAALEPCTTVLSPYMKFGCISCRLFHARLVQVEREKKQHTIPPTSLVGQLLWREFFYAAGAGTPNYDRMEGNPVCKQVDWDENEEFYRAWDEGRTGFPWIDAIMKQLHHHGWLHHLARHATACFLTRGDLYVPWEKGAATFDRLLIDGDWSVNTGNWMWLSASAYFSQFFRVYSPISFGRKYDKQGAYIRHFLPVLKDMPEKYIYEPWTAPEEVQRKANCIIGKDYPRPLVDHATKHKENLDRIKACYDAAKDPSKPTVTKHHEQAEAENNDADHDHDLHAPASDEEDAKDNEEEPEAKQSPKGQSPKGTKRGTGSTPSKTSTSSPRKRTRSAASSPDKKPASLAKKRTK